MIIKFDSGGTAPFVSYTPLKFNTASNYDSSSEENRARRGSSDSKESGKLTEKDLLMAIKDLDALPSDSVQLYDLMVDFIRMLEMGYADPTMLATQFIRMLQHMKNSVYRKNAFEEAYKNVKENNGLNEYAVTDTGDIVVASSDGGIKFASIEQVLSGEYKPLTNADLLRLRAESYAGNDTLTQIVSNGIGMEKIVLLINLAMKSVGSSLETYEGLSRDPLLQATVEAMRELLNKINIINSSSSSDEERQKAISELLAALKSLSQRYAGATELGLYKYTESGKNSNKLLEYALNYIYNVLPKNARTILNLHSGGDGKLMIGSLLLSTASTEHSLKWDMLENADGTKPGTKESTDAKGERSNFITNVQNGYGGDYSNIIINSGTNAEMSVTGVNYRSIVDKNGNTIQSSTISSMLANSGLQGITNTSSIYFGNLKLNSDTLNKVVYRNLGATRVFLPCVKSNGEMSPDFEILDRFLKEVIDKVNKEVNDNTTFEKRMLLMAKYMKEANYQELLDSNGLPNMNKFGVFLIVDGYLSGKNANIEEDSKWIEQVDIDDNAAYDLYDSVLSTKDNPYESDRHGVADYIIGWIGDTYEKLYKASVYIPIVTNNKLLALTSVGVSVSDVNAKKYLSEYNNYSPDRMNKIINMLSTNSDLLWQQ